MSWVWTRFIELPWWAMLLWFVYALYFFIRAYHVWDETSDQGLVKGYRRVFFGHEKDVRLYHIIRIILDIPPALVGLFFPLLRFLFHLKVYTIRDGKE